MIELNENLPEAETDRSKGISIVWLIPLIALLVGAWLAFKAVSEKGPEILIVFDKAEGLDPGQTRIKYKEVDIGKVSKVSLSKDLSQVHVHARLNKSMSGHLNENTRFWIVSPRISTSGISGLSTLISGIHIAMDPGEGEESIYSFVGLESPPEIEVGQAGKKYTLTADSLGSLDYGAPVYFRQIQVGELIGYDLADSGDEVEISIFIKEKYKALIHHNTRFWYASGINVDLQPDGLNADIESLVALFSGGIAFETPVSIDVAQDATMPDEYVLHPNYRSAVEKPYTETRQYVMYFEGSLKGLQFGSPVEFRGIDVGRVVSVELKIDHETLEVKAPVVVELHPETIISSKIEASPEEVIDEWIGRGLRAQLSTSNLLTGQLYVDLEFHENVSQFKRKDGESIAEFPTVPPTIDKLADSATITLEKIASMPLLEISQEIHGITQSLNAILNEKDDESVLNNLTATLNNVRSLSDDLSQSVPQISSSLSHSLMNLNKTLENTQSIVANDSRLLNDIRKLIRSLTDASRSFESLSNYLERNPSTLLYGKPGARQ